VEERNIDLTQGNGMLLPRLVDYFLPLRFMLILPLGDPNCAHLDAYWSHEMSVCRNQLARLKTRARKRQWVFTYCRELKVD